MLVRYMFCPSNRHDIWTFTVTSTAHLLCWPVFTLDIFCVVSLIYWGVNCTPYALVRMLNIKIVKLLTFLELPWILTSFCYEWFVLSTDLFILFLVNLTFCRCSVVFHDWLICSSYDIIQVIILFFILEVCVLDVEFSSSPETYHFVFHCFMFLVVEFFPVLLILYSCGGWSCVDRHSIMGSDCVNH